MFHRGQAGWLCDSLHTLHMLHMLLQASATPLTLKEHIAAQTACMSLHA